MLNTVLLTQGQDLFQELFFGSGAPLGFLIISVLSLLMVYRIKESAMIFIPFTFLIALYLLFNIPVGSSFMWYICMMYFVLALALSFLTAFTFVKGD